MMTVLLCAALQAPVPVARANDNRVAAGELKNGVLTLKLDVVRASFHPDRDDDPGVTLMAFAEKGKQPSIPGPLIRAPRGTEGRQPQVEHVDRVSTVDSLDPIFRFIGDFLAARR